MTKRKAVRVQVPDGEVDAELGPDVDLATDVVRDSKGRRIDDAYAERAAHAAQAYVGRRGRPSLSGKREPSPVIRARVPEELHQRFVERAADEGKTPSQLAREAFEAFLR